MEKFTDFLRSKRMEKRITLRMACSLTGIDPVEYSKMERGVVRPEKSKVDAIVENLGLSDEDNGKLVELADKDRNDKDWKPANQELVPAFICTENGRPPTKEELEKVLDFLDRMKN